MFLEKIKYYIFELNAELKVLNSGIKYLFSTKKRAVYIGCTKMGNIGDESVFSGIKHLIGEKIYLYEIPYNKPSSGRIFRKIFFKEPQFIILGGGTIIKKKKSESYLYLFNKFSLLYPNAKLIVFGSGVADPILAAKIGFSTDVLAWSETLNKCSFIALRGGKSKQILETNDWSVNCKVEVLHDPAIYFKRKNILYKCRDKKIGLNFCNILGRIYGLNQLLVENFFKDLVVSLLNHDWEIYLYPTCVSDIEYMEKCLKGNILDKVNIYHYYKDLNKSLCFFDTVDVFIGQRLHSIVFSAITYTPFHAIEYEHKTTDFLETLGIYNSKSRTDSLDVNFVMDEIINKYENCHIEQEKLFYFVKKQKGNS